MSRGVHAWHIDNIVILPVGRQQVWEDNFVGE